MVVYGCILYIWLYSVYTCKIIIVVLDTHLKKGFPHFSLQPIFSTFTTPEGSMLEIVPMTLSPLLFPMQL